MSLMMAFFSIKELIIYDVFSDRVFLPYVMSLKGIDASVLKV